MGIHPNLVEITNLKFAIHFRMWVCEIEDDKQPTRTKFDEEH